MPPLACGRMPVTALVSETLVRVLVEPEIDLLVKVSVVARPTRVSDELGKVNAVALRAVAFNCVFPVAPPIVPLEIAKYPASPPPAGFVETGPASVGVRMNGLVENANDPPEPVLPVVFDRTVAAAVEIGFP